LPPPKREAYALAAPIYGRRKPRRRLIDPFVAYLRERVTAYPGRTGRRLLRNSAKHGYEGGHTAVTDLLREIRPSPSPLFEVCFKTPPGEQLPKMPPCQLGPSAMLLSQFTFAAFNRREWPRRSLVSGLLSWEVRSMATRRA
jgi:hypothetical protein